MFLQLGYKKDTGNSLASYFKILKVKMQIGVKSNTPVLIDVSLSRLEEIFLPRMKEALRCGVAKAGADYGFFGTTGVT